MKVINEQSIGRDAARNFRQLNEELASAAASATTYTDLLAKPSAWVTVSSFSNSWVAFGAGWSTPRYRKIGDIVYVQGMIKDGTSGLACFTLPVGFRPTEIQVFHSTTSTGVVRMDVGSNGQVIVYAGGAGVWAGINCQFATT